MHEVGEGHWRLRVFAGREYGKDPPRFPLLQGTKRQAQSAPARLVTEVEQQEVGAAGAPKLGELLDRWLDYISPNVLAGIVPPRAPAPASWAGPTIQAGPEVDP